MGSEGITVVNRNTQGMLKIGNCRKDSILCVTVCALCELEMCV